MPRNPQNPLEGITLEQILKALVDHHGWDELGRRIKIKCFTTDPSVKSSLTFLRRTPWAREKVERLYLSLQAGTLSSDSGKRRTKGSSPAKE
jgi:uncharacterized protein (DUF2132 family)